MTATKPLVRTDHKTFRSLLSDLMLTRTQVEAAAFLGISQPTLSKYLSEPSVRVPVRLIRQFSKRLSINAEDLARLIAQPNKTQ